MKKVLIGISGGVDSAVAAAILKEQGYEVIGITLKLAANFDEQSAKKVAEDLNIKLLIKDYQKEFKEEIIDKFLTDYKMGLTPNPCLLCNKMIKLNFIYREMKNLNYDFIATGHYAKVREGRLYKSKDQEKDQTYFLSSVPKCILEKTIFPLESLPKKQVRKIASNLDLAVASKKDSTDICFINEKFKHYLEKEIRQSKGPIIDIDTNQVIGTHNGLSKYTIGQRKGLNIGGTVDRAFVHSKDMDKNILYVTVGNLKNLVSTSCLVVDVNWLSPQKVTNCQAKFRYHSQNVLVNLKWQGKNQLLVEYPSGVKAVTPGQACVFYHEDECLGGGIIQKII